MTPLLQVFQSKPYGLHFIYFSLAYISIVGNFGLIHPNNISFLNSGITASFTWSNQLLINSQEPGVGLPTNYGQQTWVFCL